MDGNGNPTDQYTWDAFGNQLSTSGFGTPDNVGYDGERIDHETGNYYLRARYMNPSIDRFTTMDSYEGDTQEPMSLHKYSFCENDAINSSDPNGNFDLSNSSLASDMLNIFSSWPISMAPVLQNRIDPISRGEAILGLPYAHSYMGQQAGSITVTNKGIPMDCSDFISYCFLTPDYRAWEFQNNPFFTLMTNDNLCTPNTGVHNLDNVANLEMGDVIIWDGYDSDGGIIWDQCHAAIYTGLGDTTISELSLGKNSPSCVQYYPIGNAIDSTNKSIRGIFNRKMESHTKRNKVIPAKIDNWLEFHYRRNDCPTIYGL